MADILISDCGYAGEPGALATVELGPGETLRLPDVTALLASLDASWEVSSRVRALMNQCRRDQVPLPGERVACACRDLGAEAVAVLTCARSRRRRRWVFHYVVVGRRAFERRWRRERHLAWRFLARFTDER